MKIVQSILKTSIACCAFVLVSSVQATVVQFQTSLGDIEVNLYDETTPETVQNFLFYVNDGLYTDSVIHRMVPGFIVQGGGFNIVSETIGQIPAVTSPINEPKYSSVEGTIAMAKLGGDPNSATNQWFFNVGNNSRALDTQNGGFTVFGEVTAGLAIVKEIARLNSYNITDASKVTFFDSPRVQFAFGETPLVSYSNEDLEAFLVAPSQFLVIIHAIVVLDDTIDSAAGLNPTPNTLLYPKKKKKWYGSSDISLLCLFGLFLLGLGRRKAIKHAI